MLRRESCRVVDRAIRRVNLTLSLDGLATTRKTLQIALSCSEGAKVFPVVEHSEGRIARPGPLQQV